MKKITLLLILWTYAGFSQTEDFEGGTIPATWAVMNGANGIGAAQPWILNTTPNPNPSPYLANSGTHAAYVNTEQIGINNTEEDWLITDARVVPANGQLRFFTRQTVNGDQGTSYQIRVSQNAVQTNQAAFTTIQTWTESDLQDLNGNIEVYVEQVVDFPASFIGATVYIAFVRTFTQPGTQRAGDRWLIDDVRLTEKCVDPNGLGTSSVTSSGVSLTWSNLGLATNFEIEIVPTGQIPSGNGFNVTVAGTNPTGYTTTAADIVLQPDTFYEYYVRAVCGTAEDPVNSGWGGPFPFTTLTLGSVCADPLVIGALPFSTSGNTANYGDDFDTSQGTGCGAAPAGTNYLAGDEVFYSFTATATGLVSFTMTPQGTPAGNSSMFIYEGCANVGVTCVGGAASANATPRVVTLTVTANMTYIVVISSSAANQSVGYNLVIQNEDCVPKPVGLPTTGITLTSAILQWDNPNAFEAWQVAIQELGDPIPSVAGVSVTSNPYTAEGLTAGTQYQYWVRAECTPGSGIFTAWAGPYPFNTQICEPENACTHIFRMTDSANNGWNGARMEVRQNGIVLATIGATYNAGPGPVDIPVQLCNGINFDLVWVTAGSQPQQCVVAIVNSFGQTIFTKAAGTGTPGGNVYTNLVDCVTPRCDIPPTNLQVPVPTITTNSAVFTWTSPATTSWDVFIVPAGDPAPTASTIPLPEYDNIVVADVNNPSFLFTSLLADTSYSIYVRVNCNFPGPSAWAGPVTFTTLPTCPKPTALGVLATTTTSTTLTWTNGTPTDTLWEVLLVPSPTITPPAQLPLVNPVIGPGTVFFQTTTPSPLVLAAGTLTPATIYFYYIRTVCPGDDKSTWSGPFVFNTVTCEPEDKCTYKFILTDSGANGWNGARMQVRQNGILIQTIGATISGAGPTTVNVLLCNDVPFDLFWSIEGTAPDQVGVSIQNPFTDIIFTKAPGEGTPLEIIYASTGDCTPPTCPKPTALSVTVAATTQTSAELFWTENALPAPGATQWEVYAVPVGTAPPPVNGSAVSGVAPFYIANSNPYIIQGLLPGTTYIYYVRSLCSGTDISTWTILNPKTFTTKPLNDECEFATPVPVNPTRVCTLSAQGNTLGATRSLPNTAPVCPGNTDDDIWFSFQATSTIHIITFSNIVGGTVDINHTLYAGNDCTALTQLYCSNPDVSIANNLTIGNFYKIRVYTNGGSATQSAAFTVCITTPPPVLNDECDNATVAQVNNGLECNVFTEGSVTGATASTQTSTCAGTEDDDIWFTFTATSPTHLITFANIEGTNNNLVHALYSGDLCGNLTLLYCSDPEESTAENLIVGNTYKIRVWSSVATLQDIVFDLCIGRILPPISASTTLYTKQQLIEDIFLKSTCLNVTNITWSTGSNFGSTNGIGYFNKEESEFPYEDGIVLTTGNADNSPGPNLTILSDGGTGNWIDPDPDLEAIVLEATGQAMNGRNVTKLEFDFVPLSPILKFNFVFASDEYGTFQCAFSDSFAFLLTNLLTNETVNLAVVEATDGTISPISVVTIRDQLYNPNCESVNADIFGTYYGDLGVNPIGAPINFNGVTEDIEISAPILPGVPYHIKLVIADRQDTAFDSAIFLEGGSFNIGNVELGSNFLEADGTAVCLGDTVTIDSGLDPDTYTFEWFRNTDELLEGENSPVLIVNEEGTYTIKATYLNTDCFAEDFVIVEYFQDTFAGTPVDLVDCDSSGTSTFDLTENEALILAPFGIGTHEPFYFLTLEDAQNNVLANGITTPEAFLGTNGQEIFVRVNKVGTSCHQVVSFTLVVQDLTPQFTLAGNTAICPEASTTISVVPTNNNFDPSAVVYTWFSGPNPIANQTGSSLIITGSEYGDYSVTVNNSGCTANVPFQISNSNTNWTFDIVPSTTTLCPDETGSITINITNNTTGAPAEYTYVLPDGSVTLSSSNVLPIDTPGQYAFSVEILGCVSSQQLLTIGDGVANFEVTFLNEPYIICQSQSVPVSFTADNFDINNPNAVYTWELPDGSQAAGATISANQVGVYTLTVDILGCTVDFPVTVNENTSAIEFAFESGCDENNDFVLTALPLNGSFDPLTSTYVWTSTASFNQIPATPESIVVTAKGDFTLLVTTLDGCFSEQTVTIDDVSCVIQKGISPNNDGKNDNFDLSTLDVKRLAIFNRYGTEVYNLNNYVDQWFGQTNSGEELPDGTYFYVIDKDSGKNVTGWIYINR